MSNFVFTKEQKQFLFENYGNVSNPELAKLFNKKFFTNITAGQVKSFKQRNKLKSGWRNQSEAGSERVELGYIKIKAENGKWEWKHHWLYKKYKGDIPEGFIVCFLDGDTRNFDLDNLTLLTRKESILMRRFGFYSKDKELTQAGLTLIRLLEKIKQKSKL